MLLAFSPIFIVCGQKKKVVDPVEQMKTNVLSLVQSKEKNVQEMVGMCARNFGRIVNITSGTVKLPLPDHALSQGPRAGLTAACAGLARQVARHNVTINGLLPGQHLTERMQSGLLETARSTGKSREELIAKRVADIPAGRVGDPFEFGEACAFLCSAHSGYIVGQNLLLDGGRFNSTLG